MKRVIVVPLSDVARFPDLEVIARHGSLAALVGDTARGRSRAAYDSEESFLDAVSRGFADRHTFHTLDEAAIFAQAELDYLAREAKRIEDALNQRATQRLPPERHSNGLFGIVERQKNAGSFMTAELMSDQMTCVVAPALRHGHLRS